MSNLKLIIANKKYSSWSMRPWLAMKVAGIEFEEVLSRFDMDTMHAHFWEFSPTNKVSVLQHRDCAIWDSLAILEYLAENNPDRGLWPADRAARAHARCVSNEMHAGFPALREQCPMNMARTPAKMDLTAETQVDVLRVGTIWAEYLEQYGGPYLFGGFTIADAMYAPVVNRIEIYEIPKTHAMEAYCATIKSLPAYHEWERAGAAEPWICENVEV